MEMPRRLAAGQGYPSTAATNRSVVIMRAIARHRHLKGKSSCGKKGRRRVQMAPRCELPLRRWWIYYGLVYECHCHEKVSGDKTGDNPGTDEMKCLSFRDNSDDQ